MRDEVLRLPKKVQQKVDELLDWDVPEALKFIHASVDRLDRMVAALLKLARLGRREMIYKEVDMSKLVSTVLQSFYHQIEKKHIQMETGPMPQIETDHLAMEQIISNLLDNAIKYLDTDRPGKISISCSDKGAEYILSVQDHGRGIDAADREKIFEIFRRAGREDMPGEGMGLATVRTLIRQLGGRVWCESELGLGTTLNLTVPKRPSRAELGSGKM
jgi:signal transduction histidine kinase